VIYLAFDSLARRVRERFHRDDPDHGAGHGTPPPATDAGN
jgi:multidrug efflux pump